MDKVHKLGENGGRTEFLACRNGKIQVKVTSSV